MTNSELPLLTIRCITYNHEPYIRKCLEGFVMQQTNFKFEAIVHDDASTDGTAAIVSEFAEKYPDIIKPILQTENQYSKRNGSIGRIMSAHMRGKYAAICEGDDYWTDPLKLQKQVDFLEANPDFSMCFHKVEVIAEDENLSTNYYKDLEEREYFGDEIIEKGPVPTASSVMLAECYYKRPIHKGFKVGDNVIFATCAKFGRIMCLSDVMGVYRRSDSGASRTLTYKVRLEHFVAMLECFPEYDTTLRKMVFNFATLSVKLNLKQGKFKSALNSYCLAGKGVGYFKLSNYILSWTIGIRYIKNKINNKADN